MMNNSLRVCKPLLAAWTVVGHQCTLAKFPIFSASSIFADQKTMRMAPTIESEICIEGIENTMPVRTESIYGRHTVGATIKRSHHYISRS